MSGAYCDSSAKQCKAKVAVGAACPNYRACDANAYCDPRDEQCKTLGDVGAACEGDFMCASGFCNASKVCAVGFPGSTGLQICVE